ncbi:MAG: hypothetical protein GC168_00170 [Candidatus Hydrogenedens sp.]|nr:hypothetical protein [Candidatus Hydrogenedens sp.]
MSGGGVNCTAHDVPFLDIAERLEQDGVRVAPGILACDRDEGRLAAAQGARGPLWLKSVGEGNPRFCMELQFPEDLSLGFIQAIQRSTSNAVLVQRGENGPVYRLHCDRELRPVSPVMAEASLAPDSPYRVVMELTLPGDLSSERAQQLSAIARRTEALLEDDSRRWLEIEVVCTEAGPVLTDVWLSSTPTVIMTALQRAGLDGMPHGGDNGSAFSVAWLRSRSGVIRRIEGLERARALRSVVDVVVHATLGDVVGHVVDKQSRDRLGYVLAKGDTPTDARNHALHGRGLIFIETEIAMA